MAKNITFYKLELRDVKEKLVVVKEALYKKCIKLNLVKDSDAQDKLREEIKTLSNDYEELNDKVEELERIIEEKREKNKKR